MIYGKEDFIKIFNSTIKREGADKLLAFLETSDFFTAPASTRYHCAFEGGLVSHSVNVYKRLLFNIENEFGSEWEKYYSHETIAICSLLHDLCKVSYYKKDYRNVKENGQWVKKEVYVKEEDLPYGHGEKSVYILQSFIKLTREEAVAINFHMGGFDVRVKGGDGSISEAYDKFPLAIMLHVSDIEATYLDEKRG
ncbi:MAG: hydrolase [Clostridia bacterium]|nr:hydrolase [Clostridia bacterium]